MKVDMHFHAVGGGHDIDAVDEDIFFNPDDNHHWFARALYQMLDANLEELGAEVTGDGRISTAQYMEVAYHTLATSKEIDAVVLLALDALWSPTDGSLDRTKTDLWVSNRFLARTIESLNARLQADPAPAVRAKRFFLGASVSPNRPDWDAELQWVLAESGAVLLKLIPSVQHVDLLNARHDAFFDALAESGLPLLSHVGPEYSFPEGIRMQHLDGFSKLTRALERGVTVIAAHCATPVFPIIDKDELKAFLAFMTSANAGGNVRLWADTSALSLTTRIPYLPRIVDEFPPSWLLHGSDFPIPVDGWAHLPFITHDVTPADYLAIRKAANPLDRDVLIKRAVGFSDEILTNPTRVLRGLSRAP